MEEVKVLSHGPSVSEQVGGWAFLLSAAFALLVVITQSESSSSQVIVFVFLLPFLAIGAWFALRREGVLYNITRGEIVAWRNFLWRRTEERTPFDRFDRVCLGYGHRSKSRGGSVVVYTVSLSRPLIRPWPGELPDPSAELKHILLSVYERREQAAERGKVVAEALGLRCCLSPELEKADQCWNGLRKGSP